MYTLLSLLFGEEICTWQKNCGLVLCSMFKTALRLYGSTALRLYGSTALRLYGSMALCLYGSRCLRLSTAVTGRFTHESVRQWPVPRSFIHCRAKQISILDIGSRSDSHIFRRWQTDIRHWRIDFIRWRSDSLAKRPVFLYGISMYGSTTLARYAGFTSR